MRSTSSNYHPWHLIPVNPGRKVNLGRTGIIVIIILGLLILGLFAVLLVPQFGRTFPAASAVSLRTDQNPAPANIANFNKGYASINDSALLAAVTISFAELVASNGAALLGK